MLFVRALCAGVRALCAGVCVWCVGVSGVAFGVQDTGSPTTGSQPNGKGDDGSGTGFSLRVTAPRGLGDPKVDCSRVSAQQSVLCGDGSGGGVEPPGGQGGRGGASGKPAGGLQPVSPKVCVSPSSSKPSADVSEWERKAFQYLLVNGDISPVNGNSPIGAGQIPGYIQGPDRELLRGPAIDVEVKVPSSGVAGIFDSNGNPSLPEVFRERSASIASPGGTRRVITEMGNLVRRVRNYYRNTPMGQVGSALARRTEAQATREASQHFY